MKGHPNLVSIFVDKFYVLPFHVMYQHEKESSAFNQYRDGTASEDTTIYIYCAAKKPVITRTQVSSDGRSVEIDAHLGVPNKSRSFNVFVNEIKGPASFSDVRIKQAAVPEDDDLNIVFTFSDGSSLQFSTWYICKTHGPAEFKHLKVFYVGKGDSDNYQNGSLDRVINGHKKLQKFQNRLKPGFIPVLLLGRLTFVYAFDKYGAEAPLLRQDMADRGKWRTRVFEAAMINYFKPTFNELGKSHFPTRFIRDLAHAPNVDLVLNEIVTTDHDVLLSSFHVDSSFGHMFGEITFSKRFDVKKVISDMRRKVPITTQDYRQLFDVEDIVSLGDSTSPNNLSLA